MSSLKNIHFKLLTKIPASAKEFNRKLKELGESFKARQNRLPKNRKRKFFIWTIYEDIPVRYDNESGRDFIKRHNKFYNIKPVCPALRAAVSFQGIINKRKNK